MGLVDLVNLVPHAKYELCTSNGSQEKSDLEKVGQGHPS
jgi:hypothetical protein